eukprot:1181064-Prorocentrum_minimum.AAC.2
MVLGVAPRTLTTAHHVPLHPGQPRCLQSHKDRARNIRRVRVQPSANISQSARQGQDGRAVSQGLESSRTVLPGAHVRHLILKPLIVILNARSMVPYSERILSRIGVLAVLLPTTRKSGVEQLKGPHEYSA